MMSSQPAWLSQQGNAVVLDISVQPRSSSTGIVGVHDGALRVRLTAPPVDGAANAALIAWCAKALGVRRADVSIVSGQTSRRKRVAIQGISATHVVECLQVPNA